MELEKSFCCLCCRSGPLSVVTLIPVTGYVSGQVIPITCEVDNASNVNIDKVKFTLRKRVTFRVTQPRADKKETKVTIKEIAIGPMQGKTETFTQQLEIPTLPPTNFLNCNIIAVDYDLMVYIETKQQNNLLKNKYSIKQVTCEVSGPHQNLSGYIPITLGTIPLTSFKPPVPYTDVPVKPQEDPSMLPTQPVSPANGTGGAMGWNIADSNGAGLYPNIRKSFILYTH